MEIEIGKEVVKTSADFVSKKIDKFNFNCLRKYFEVDDTYIVKKLCLILFPYKYKDWGDDSEGSLSRPELYIPIISLITYILLRALYFGLEGKFSPEKLGRIFTRTVFLEFCCLALARLAGYFIEINPSSVDLLAYFGYKYVVILLLHVCRFRLLKYVSGIYLYPSFLVFLGRSIKGLILHDTSGDRVKKVYFLFFIVFLQIVVVFFLS